MGLVYELQLPEGIGQITKVSGQSLLPVFPMLTLSSGVGAPPPPPRKALRVRAVSSEALGVPAGAWESHVRTTLSG